MNRKAYAVVFAFICLPLASLLGCGGSSSSTPPTYSPQVVGIKASSGTSQSAASGKAFAAPLTVTVTTGGIATAGETVKFTAPASGASGIFANGTATETDVTNSDGVATSSTFSANTVGGAYSVTATVSGAASPVTFNLTNLPATSYAFSMSGQDVNGVYYALAGSIAIDPTGKVLAGEQDYNDGSAGLTSPEPSGDQITGGTLTFASGAPAGQATLTLVTNNPTLGNPMLATSTSGTEVFGVQFVNSKHALIMEYDGLATSSGSMDLQTLPSKLNGSYAFALSGSDVNDQPFAFGGVFTVAGSSLTNGTIDVNDVDSTGVVSIGKAFSGTISPADSFGRGTISGVKIANIPVSLNYYVVGPEAIRLIDVDSVAKSSFGIADSASGSAFGQGAGTFSNASLGPSVLAIAGNQLAQFGALAQFTTSSTSSSPANFSGVGDDNEPANGVLTSPPVSAITGTYSIGSNGYGSLAFSPGLGDINELGIYMTDPTLNLDDPNNTIGGGGALVLDLDSGQLGAPLPGGAGVIIPQTDATTVATATSDFAGNYAAGWQNFGNMGCGCEFDMLAQGTMVANGALSLTGLVSDPFFSFGTADATSSGDTFVGTPLAD